MPSSFSRTELAIGTAAVDRLRQSCVAVLGVGGVGSYAAEAVARAGVGRVILLDKDTIDITNINRQIPALVNTVGQPKVDVMAERIRAINPDCTVVAVQSFFSPETTADLFALAPDYVIDAMDTVSAKLELICACRKRGVPIVSSMGAANKLDPTAFRVMDISETRVDPIARILRRELRRRGIATGVSVVCSSEAPRRPDPEVLTAIAPVVGSGQPLTRKAANPPASVSFVPPVAGMIMAGVAITALAGLA
ncbi:MAG: tRNA threonylcarbamoyladenosine dehydratase [Firmicutes bacterium]|nr:tRNA threonylcarbamoyladenosine dehydratase [Bacillota bacterium]